MLSNTQLGVGSILLVLIFTLLNLDATPSGAARPHVVQIEAVEGKSKQLLPPNDPDVWMQQTPEKKQTSVDDLIEKIGQITDPVDLRRLRARLGPNLALSSSADPPKTGVSTGASATSRLTCGEDTTWIAPYYPRDPKYSALESQYAIPLTIWQTTKSREVKKAVCLNVKTTLDLNPEVDRPIPTPKRPQPAHTRTHAPTTAIWASAVTHCQQREQPCPCLTTLFDPLVPDPV